MKKLIIAAAIIWPMAVFQPALLIAFTAIGAYLVAAVGLITRMPDDALESFCKPMDSLFDWLDNFYNRR